LRKRIILPIGNFLKNSLSDLLDQDSAFGRIALLQVLALGADTFVTISLAGTLFFSISVHEARSRIILYLLLTMAPFAVITPFLGPLIDKGRKTRKSLLYLSLFLRAWLVILMSLSINNILLFPEAFGVMVTSKLFMVIRSALMPEYVSASQDLPSLNARLAFLSSLAGFIFGGVAIAIFKIFGSIWVLRLDALIYFAALFGALRLIKDPDARDSINLFQYGSFKTKRFIMDEETIISLAAMSVLRGSTGFVTFFLAFALRNMHAATYLYGYVLGASTLGSLLGSLSVKFLRRNIAPTKILQLGLFVAVVLAGLAGWVGNVYSQAMATFAIGFGGAIAKPSYDAIIQTNIAELNRGRAFARSESQLQLIWVLGGLLATLFAFKFQEGDLLLAVACAIGFSSYLASHRAFKANSKKIVS
jgi:MFS family permease